MSATEFRTPVSVLVVIYSDDGQALLLRRVKPFEFWQSVTGSLRTGESHAEAAGRELFEETGLCDAGRLCYSGVSRQFVIDPRWRHKFAPGVVENVEFEWHYRLPAPTNIRICNSEHSEYCWLPIAAAAQRVWSWTNRDALVNLRC
ncbi:MAG: dihydroneopterin triphosphate diphosphatase [Gammaproteobacteria bacterium]|nr:dihydroneopterin triphosphate diphosphatase [Gammaproteobacteria bacterium]MDH5303551.1 dihydroneopterin triphosphate diphosphatase [Gammaproteobacteria bacterium]MDH5322233.1 dihydroneopterin triphosphate diphosphatase [Gammaproteobacteria bacterium]